MVTFPPALSTPAFTDSATVGDDGDDEGGNDNGGGESGDDMGQRTFCDVVVHRIDNDGNFGSRHVGVGLRGCYWREYWCFCDGSSGVGSWGRI